MPEVATHATIIQRLAKTAQDGSDNGAQEIRKFLTDPDLVSKWSTYDSPGGLQSRYGVLKSIGPDMFFAVLDYGPRIQEFDDMVVKLDGTFRAGQ